MSFQSLQSVVRLIAAILMAESNAVAQPPVKIGVVLPLTGEYATWGERIRQGLISAAKDTVHDFEFDFQDEGNCDPKLTVDAVNKFLNLNQTKIIMTGCLAGTKAIAPKINAARALVLSTGLLDDDVYIRKYPVLNLATQISTQAIVLAAHIARQDVKKIAILRWPDAFGAEFARALTEELTANNLHVVLDESGGTMTADYRSLLLRIEQLGVDALAVQLGDAHIRTLMKQIRNLNLELKVFADYTIESNAPDTDLLEGIEYTYPINEAEGSAAKDGFDRTFASEFGGSVPTANTYFAYDGLLALDRALTSCTIDDANCIRTAIIENTRSGLGGAVRFEPDGSSTRPYGIKRIAQSRYVWIEHQSPVAQKRDPPK